MAYSDHDRDLTVYGVATLSTDGQLQVRAYRTKDAASAAAEHAPRITFTAQRADDGHLVTITSVFPLVYCHAEHGWTFAAVGWHFGAIDTLTIS
jgi:hypothetical protein